MEDYNSYTFRNRDVDKMKRSQKLRMKAAQTKEKSEKAKKEGKEKKAKRLSEKANKQSNKAEYNAFKETKSSPEYKARVKSKKEKEKALEAREKKYWKDLKKTSKKVRGGVNRGHSPKEMEAMRSKSQRRY